MDRLALRGSPRNARSTLLSNELVKPLIADTTTTGFASAAAKTIFATLRKAFASSTDVPPNFITVGFNRITRSEEHTSELQSRLHLVCRLLLEKKKKNTPQSYVNTQAQRI